MSVRTGCCCINSDSCLVGNNRRRSGRYYGIIRPLAFFVVTTLLAITVSHICDKFSANTSLRIIKSDLTNLRKHLKTLSVEVKNIVEMRDELKGKIREVSVTIPKISEAVQKLTDKVSEDVGHDSHREKSVREVVKHELRTYDADKTGHTDYALKDLGGRIISTPDTETYDNDSGITVFGISICPSQNRPDSIIQTGALPGQCWSFKGDKGSVVIKLMDSVHVTSVSLEHITPDMAPTGETSSAPRDFSVWGLKTPDDRDGFLFGEFKYDNSEAPIQMFPVQNGSTDAFEFIQFKFQSNSGNPNYTCVYRIRVHGTLKR